MRNHYNSTFDSTMEGRKNLRTKRVKILAKPAEYDTRFLYFFINFYFYSQFFIKIIQSWNILNLILEVKANEIKLNGADILVIYESHWD